LLFVPLLKPGNFLYFSSFVEKREIYLKPQIHSIAREISSHKWKSLTDDSRSFRTVEKGI